MIELRTVPLGGVGLTCFGSNFRPSSASMSNFENVHFGGPYGGYERPHSEKHRQSYLRLTTFGNKI